MKICSMSLKNKAKTENSSSNLKEIVYLMERRRRPKSNQACQQALMTAIDRANHACRLLIDFVLGSRWPTLAVHLRQQIYLAVKS